MATYLTRFNYQKSMISDPYSHYLRCFITLQLLQKVIVMPNLINQQCEIHKKVCEFMCCYSKCAKHLICEKCRRQHLDIHPAQFIYELANLKAIHAYNKVEKLKEILVKQKFRQRDAINNIYQEFQSLADPFNQKIKAFANQSRALIEGELTNFLRSNKFIIDQAEKEIKKSQTRSVENDPNKMLQEVLNQAEIITRRQGRIYENGEGYRWYSDTTKELCAGVVAQIRSMMTVVIKLIDNSISLQRNKFSAQNIPLDSHHQLSFYKRYHASAQVAVERVALQGNVMHSKQMLQMKDSQLLKSKKEVRDKVIKISQLEEKIEGLTEELQAWEQKKEREEREKLLAQEKEKKLKEELLIKNGIIGSNGRSLCFERKQIDEDLFPMILELVPNPVTLDISNHKLSKEQLDELLSRSSFQSAVKVLKHNFTKVEQGLLVRCLKTFPNLVHLQLNSCEISDDLLFAISKHFTQRLRILYLIDNHITDEGLEQMFFNNLYLEQLYVSYNRLTFKCIESLSKKAHELKVLHIAKTQLKQKGGSMIGRYLKDIEELFIGATGTTKDGFLAICKNCTKLKRLSVVANQITTEVVTEILLGLKDLQWLDLSYCNLNKNDREKIEKLKIFNKDLNIVFGM